MKKVLIVNAHPEAASFCSSLKDIAKEYFISVGYEVKESDLYTMNFDPVGGKNDFKALTNTDFFKYQTEQLQAYQNDGFVEDLKAEMDKLEWCDVLIFNFPLWWFGMPAILKGWVDRVFAMGFVYGNGKGVYENGCFKNKTAFATLTTGGPAQTYTENSSNGDINSILFPLQHGVFYFAGMTVLPPFISYNPVRTSNEERIAEIERYKKYLSRLDLLKPVYTNR
ncbi:MAG: NAD(P)H-dependent oxidoreductase [Paludibacter sp.]